MYRKKWDWREQHSGMEDLVTIKGKRSGLIIVLDPAGDFQVVLDRFAEKLRQVNSFLEGSTVSIDIGTRAIDSLQLAALEQILISHKLHLRRILAGNTGKDQGVNRLVQEAKEAVSWKTRRKRKGKKAKDQFDVVVDVDVQDETAAAEVSQTVEPDAEVREEKEDIPVIRYIPVRQNRDDIISQEQTILVQRTIRSGQRVFYPGNVVVLGDVNPGGEVIAGGNIIVMGAFRGIAHAGALGKEDAIVAALRLEPSQLRIAGYITRAPEGDFSNPYQPEIARVQDGIVIIEQYQPGYDRHHRGDHKGGA